MSKIRVKLMDEGITISVTPEFLENRLQNIEGYPYIILDEEPLRLNGDYDDILQDIKIAKDN